MRGHSKLFVAGTAIMLLGATQAYGTFPIAYFEDGFVVVAIDSRQTIEGLTDPSKSSVIDNSCKIIPLDDRAFFFVEGTSRIGESGKPAFFDAFASARSHFNTARGDLEKAAVSWALSVRGLFAKAMPHAPGLEEVKGVFVGSAVGQQVVGVAASVVPIRSRNLVQHDVGIFDPGGALIGNRDSGILAEIQHGKTTRAKEVLAQIERDAQGKSPQDALAVKATALVRAVINWGSDPSVGGKVVTVILDKDGRRWFSNPGICPQS